MAISGIPGSLIPEAAVNSTAVADGEQIAVGSADGYPAIWRRALGTSSWTLVSPLSLVSGSSDLAALSSVTHGSAGWLAAGTPGPVIFTSADGIHWQAAGGNIQQDLAGVAAVATASGPGGYLIDGKLVGAGGVCVADDWFSTDLTSWARAHTAIPPTGSSQVLAVAAGPHGFVTAGSHNGQPAIWTTANGTLWTTDVLPLPTGASAALLQEVAISGDSVVALGQQTTVTGTLPLAELSTDGGKTWQQVQFVSAGQNTTVTALTAGPGGFTAAGQFGNTGQLGAAIWRSPDGTSWTQLVISGLTGGGSHDITTLDPVRFRRDRHRLDPVHAKPAVRHRAGSGLAGQARPDAGLTRLARRERSHERTLRKKPAADKMMSRLTMMENARMTGRATYGRPGNSA